MNKPCGCCEGNQPRTPERIANRPGLARIPYRVGRHATFMETMLARLSNFSLEVLPNGTDQQRADGEEPGKAAPQVIYPLRGLTTRAENDPSIALLDAWAVLADVLTFYQERIANEGYLRTAVERRSILELARLVGYTLRPGVASTVYLAYTIDAGTTEPVTIPPGTRAQTIPGPGELPQPFETVEKLEARAAWNLLQPRMKRPQTAASITAPFSNGTEHHGLYRVYLKGINTNLKANDPALIEFSPSEQRLLRVVKVTPDAAADHTVVLLEEWLRMSPGDDRAKQARVKITSLISRYRTEEVRRLGLRTTTGSFGRANEALTLLEKQLGATLRFDEQLDHLRKETLPSLERELRLASERSFTDLHPWLSGLIEGLNAILAELQTEGRTATYATEPARAAATVEAASPTAAYDECAEKGKSPVFSQALEDLVKPPSIPPRSGLVMERKLETIFTPKSDANFQMVGALAPATRGELPLVFANSKVARDVPIKFYALRVKASLFGHNAPPQSEYLGEIEEGRLFFQMTASPTIANVWQSLVDGQQQLSKEKLPLDAVYEQILPGSYIAIDISAISSNKPPAVFTVAQNQVRTLEALSMATKVSVLGLEENRWLDILKDMVGEQEVKLEDQTGFLRKTGIYAQSEELELAEEPITNDICGTGSSGGTDGLIELDGIYSELQAGRWLIVAGERTDIRTPDPDDPTGSGTVPVPGIKSSELVMLAEVIQRVPDGSTQTPVPTNGSDPLPGETYRTYIRLASSLQYCYRRDTVKIYGNVVKATHGETRSETLGSGDGSKAFQTYTLKQPPLTFVSAPVPAGVESTLHVRVNDIEWHEVDNLAFLGPNDRGFITRTSEEGKTSVIFGNGKQGARPPTGSENIRAVYRAGIGKAGNARAGQVSLLVTRPLGVKEVINPIRASGGADREDRDQARKNAPQAVLALDRLVSVQDYADFSRTFAGIGKASAARLTNGREQFVHVTIAGAGDIPIDKTSDLYQNLVRALKTNGDPHLPLRVDVRELVLMVVSAGVRLQPDYLWEAVATKIHAALLDAFSFDRRELGQDVLFSEVVTTIQNVEGVEYVDLDVLGGISEKNAANTARTPEEIGQEVQQLIQDSQAKGPAHRILVNPARVVTTIDPAQGKTVYVTHAAQLAFLSADVPATLVLNEVK